MLKIIKSTNSMNAIEIRNPTEYQRNIIREIICNQWISSEEYKLRTTCGAFLQCDSEDYILIEFWSKFEGIQPFIDFINKKFKKEKIFE